MKKITKSLARGKRVVVRLDLDVPMNNGVVLDATRLKAAARTLETVSGAKQIIIIGHAGRPKGVYDAKYSLLPIAKALAKQLKVDINLVNDVMSKDLPDSKYVMLENLRFFEGEKKNSARFAKHLASFGDIYVNDAFAVTHRKAASIVAITKYLPSYAGVHLYDEVVHLRKILKIKHPFVLLIGGAKLDKLEILNSLIKEADAILVGGTLSLSLLQSQGYAIPGNFDHDEKIAKKILKNTHVILPVDLVMDDKSVVDIDEVPKKKLAYDIGPNTVRTYIEILKSAKIVVWNGPMGYFEKKPFDMATKKIAKFLIKSDVKSVLGGGDTLSATGLKGFSHATTAGGAFLSLVGKRSMPGLDALDQ